MDTVVTDRTEDGTVYYVKRWDTGYLKNSEGCLRSFTTYPEAVERIRGGKFKHETWYTAS